LGSKLRIRFLFLLILLLIPLGNLFSQGNTAAEREELRLDESIQNLYQGLHKARALLSYPKVTTLPANTIIRYKGSYPNRTGVKIIKYNVIQDPMDRGNIKTSEEKSFYLEFNGSVLSRVEYTVKIEETGSTPRTFTKIIDESPMDDDVNGIEIHAYEGVIKDIIPLSFLKNEGINHNRNNFKKNFYIKLLQDSLIQVNLILHMQKKEKNRIHNKQINNLKNSLGY
jgi:hypothetical protein